MMCLHAQRAVANFEKSFGENKGPVVELAYYAFQDSAFTCKESMQKPRQISS